MNLYMRIKCFFLLSVVLCSCNFGRNGIKKTNYKAFISHNQRVEIKEFNNDFIFLLKDTNNQVLDRRLIRNNIYQFKIADVNSDSINDILIGVIKPTRFHRNADKRLFIYTIDDNKIIPLWLGSRVSQPLVDFTTVDKNNTVIKTIEKEKSGNYLVAEYKWNKFGLKFIKYIKREINQNQANKLLNYENN